MPTTTTISVVFAGDTPVSVVLRNPGNTYGVKRNDTDAVVVVAGVALTESPAGTWRYSFSDPALGLTYGYAWRATWDDATTTDGSGTVAGATIDAPNYLDLSTIADLLSQLPSTAVATLRAATEADQLAGAAQATAQIDQVPWQGRKYDLITPQVLQFPRVPWETSQVAASAYGGAPLPTGRLGLPTEIWDWDADASPPRAIVPRNVKLACLYQADSVLAADRDGRLDAQHDGLLAQSTGSLSEQYASAGSGGGQAWRSLCRKAAELLGQYRLKGGRIL